MEKPKEINYILSQIAYCNNYTFPKDWKDHNVSEPNSACKDLTKKVCYKLLFDYKLLVDTISFCVEGGLTCYFKNGDIKMYIEIYNDLEIGVIINNDKKKKVFYNEDIVKQDFSKAVKVFKL